MNIAIISDIHGNCYALDLVLADLRRLGVERMVCLGDAIQGGAQPRETAQRLREMGCPVVMGNADAWLLSGQETSTNEQVTEQQQIVRAWTLEQLSAEDRAWMEQFPPTIEIALEAGKKLLCFHGSPDSFDEIILPNTTQEHLSVVLGGTDATILAGGHTHTQQWQRVRQRDAWYLNPGSVGFAYHWQQNSSEKFRADPWAEYAIVTSEGDHLGITFRQVPFALDTFLATMRSSGKPNIEQTIVMYEK